MSAWCKARPSSCVFASKWGLFLLERHRYPSKNSPKHDSCFKLAVKPDAWRVSCYCMFLFIYATLFAGVSHDLISFTCNCSGWRVCHGIFPLNQRPSSWRDMLARWQGQSTFWSFFFPLYKLICFSVVKDKVVCILLPICLSKSNESVLATLPWNNSSKKARMINVSNKRHQLIKWKE